MRCAHDGRSQPCAPYSAPDRDTTRCHSADVPPVLRGDVPCPRVGLLEVPDNEGIFPPPTLRPWYPALALHRRKDLAHPVGEGVAKVLILVEMGRPNSYRLTNSPITRSCMRSVLALI